MAQKEQHSIYPPKQLSEQIEEHKQNQGHNSFSKAAVDLLEDSIEQQDRNDRLELFAVNCATNLLTGAIIVGILGVLTRLLSPVDAGVGAGLLALVGAMVAYVAVPEGDSLTTHLLGGDSK